VTRLAGLLGLAALAVSACAPVVVPTGPPTVAPLLAEDHIRTNDGERLPLRRWRSENGPPRAVVVALHGFNDYSAAFDCPGRYWAARGITTYAYDQRGFGATAEHGMWPGTETLVADLDTVIALVAARHPGVPLYVVGESMGGAVAMAAMARPHPPAIAGLVLAAPAVWGWRTMNPFYRASLWLAAHVMPWARVSGRGLGIKPSDNREMLKALARDRLTIKETRFDALYGLVDLMDAAYGAAERITVPTLFLYGAHDQLVPEGPIRDVLRRLRAPHRVALYPGGYHMLLRDLDAARVLGDVAAWIADPAAPLPSGFELTDPRRLARPGPARGRQRG